MNQAPPVEKRVSGILCFAQFQVDMQQYTLTREGHVLPLPRISMDIFLLLLEQPGKLVTRGDIAQAVWPGSSPDEGDAGDQHGRESNPAGAAR